MQIEENPNNQQQTTNEGSQNANSSSSFVHNEKEAQPNTSSIIQLFDNYSNFIGNSSDVILDMDLVLDRVLDALKKLQPPQKYSFLCFYRFLILILVLLKIPSICGIIFLILTKRE